MLAVHAKNQMSQERDEVEQTTDPYKKPTIPAIILRFENLRNIYLAIIASMLPKIDNSNSVLCNSANYFQEE